MRRIGLFGKKRVFPSLPPSSLQGLVVPLLTPMNEDRSVDEFSLKALTARLMNKGVKNFFALGIFSEQEFLLPEQKKQVLETVSREIGGTGLLVAGCFGESTDEIIANVLEAQKYTDLCAVNVPFGALERELEFIDFFDSLFTQTNSKILIYNNAFAFRRSIPALWLDNIVNWERLLGVVDSSRNPEYLDELGKYYQLTKLFEENEEMAFDALRRGFSGLACISSSVFPAYYLSLIDDFAEMDFFKVMRTEARILALNKMLPNAKKIQAFKHVLSVQGMIRPFFSSQLGALSEKEKSLVESAFRLRTASVQK